jgi:hypothetical protein
MPSSRRLIALGAVLLVTASGIALAETMSDHNAMRPGQMQEMMGSGQHPMGSSEMQRMMRRHHQQDAMPVDAHAEIGKSPYAGQ